MKFQKIVRGFVIACATVMCGAAMLPAMAEDVGTDPRAEMSKNDFGYLVDITVLYDPGANVISDFPALVRLSPSGISGFDYAYFKSATGADLAFYDAKGNHLPHEIDTWNTSGESLVWVKIPTLTKNMVITACLGNDSLTVQPDPTVVWSNYALVWHFGDHLTDSTGHNLAYTLGSAATVTGESLGDCVSVNSGAASLPTPFPYLTTASSFYLSFWARCTMSESSPAVMVSTKSARDGTESGFAIDQSFGRTHLFGGSEKCFEGGFDTYYCYAGGWHHPLVRYNGQEVSYVTDAGSSYSAAKPIAAVSANENTIELGGNSGENKGVNSQRWHGKFDEVRFSNEPVSAPFNAADYKCVTDAGFYSYGSCRENVPVEDYEVSIVASADADEKTGSHGVFTVSRPSDKTEKQVKVNYAIGGTAVAGREYEQLTGLLVIPAGEATGTIDVTPLPSPFVVRDTTVVVTLAEGGYHIDEDHSVATVTVRNGNGLLPYWEYHTAGKYYTDGVVSLGRNGTTGHDPKGFLMASEPPDGLAYTLDFDKPVRICDDSTGVVGVEESAITSVNNVDGSALSTAWNQTIRGFVYPSGLTGSVSGPKNLNYVEGTITMPVGVTGGTVSYLGASGQGITFVLQSPFALGNAVFRNSKILEIVNGHHMQGAIAGNAFYSSLQSYTGAVLDFSGVTTIAAICISGNNTYIKTGVRIRLGENFRHTASILGQSGTAIREIEGFPSPVLDQTTYFNQCSFVDCGEECTLPESVKEIANGSFLNSTGFVSFVSMAATSVLTNAWSGFKGLKSISFKTKDKMVVLGDSAFAAPQLTRVEFNGAAPDPANVGTIFATLPEKQVTVYVPRDKGWEALADNGVIPGTITKGTRQKIKYQGGLVLLVR